MRLWNCSLASIKVSGVLPPCTHLAISYRQIQRNSATRGFGYKWPMKMESIQNHLENGRSEKTATGPHQLFSFTESLGMRWDKTEMGNDSLWAAGLRMLLACSWQPERKLEEFWHPLHPRPKKFSTGVNSCCCVKMSLTNKFCLSYFARKPSLCPLVPKPESWWAKSRKQDALCKSSFLCFFSLYQAPVQTCLEAVSFPMWNMLFQVACDYLHCLSSWIWKFQNIGVLSLLCNYDNRC